MTIILVQAFNLYLKLEKLLVPVYQIINFGRFFKYSLLLCKASGKYELPLVQQRKVELCLPFTQESDTNFCFVKFIAM